MRIEEGDWKALRRRDTDSVGATTSISGAVSGAAPEELTSWVPPGRVTALATATALNSSAQAPPGAGGQPRRYTPITPPSLRVMTMVADRGRPAGP